MYIRTKDKIFMAEEINGMIISRGEIAFSTNEADIHKPLVIKKKDVIKQADTIEELLDEFVFIENGKEHNIVYLPEAKDRLDEYHNGRNYEPRLIGRIKVGLDKKAVAEWKELTEGKYKGCYDWELL